MILPNRFMHLLRRINRFYRGGKSTRAALLCAVLLLPMQVPAADDVASAGVMTEVMRAMFLSAQGRHLESAEIFAALGKETHSAALMGEASTESLRGKAALSHTLHYAELWREYGGGLPALRMHAQVLLLQQKWVAARAVLNTLKTDGATPDIFYKTLAHAGNMRAILAREFLDDNPDGNYYLARTGLELGDWMLAKESIARGAAGNERLAEFQMLRMQMLASQTKQWLPLLTATADYTARQCPGFAGRCDDATILHAYFIFARHGNWQEPVLPEEAALSAARVMEAAGQIAQAREYYKQSRGFESRLGLARLARQDGKWAAALAFLRDAAAANDGEFSQRETLATNILKEWKGVAAALPRIKKARVTLPNDASLIYLESNLREENGDVDGAVVLLRRMVELFPNSGESWNALGYVLADHNRNLGEAEIYVKKALTFVPNSPSYLDSLGWVYFRQGRLQEALRYLLRAAHGLTDAVILTHLGEVYWLLDKRDYARTAFNNARAVEPNNPVLLDTLRRLKIQSL